MPRRPTRGTGPWIGSANTLASRRINVIGVGAGVIPIALQRRRFSALNETRVVVVMDKVQEESDLVEMRWQICGRFIKDPGSYRFVEMADPKTRERW